MVQTQIRRFFNTENGARLREKRGYIMDYKENDFAQNEGQAEKISIKSSSFRVYYIDIDPIC